MSHEICHANNTVGVDDQCCLSGDKPFFDVHITKSHVAKTYQLVSNRNPISSYIYWAIKLNKFVFCLCSMCLQI